MSQRLERELSGVVMVMMVAVMPVRSERGTGDYSKQQCNKDPLLHGMNLAWDSSVRINEGTRCITKPTCSG